MYKHTVDIRVRYGETDQMGYLYYGHYAQYYEVGRVELIRSLGITYKQLEDEHGIWLPVVSLDMRFVRPAYYDELLQVKTTLRTLPDTHIVFHVEVFNAQNKLVNAGRVRLCFFDAREKRVVPAPDFLLERLVAYFPDNPEKEALD
ncbi:MAG: thioesterase family protein [Saprospiraceae bacterium]|nr:thioesterase family protein [Saprospiraceae bacterium]